MATSHRSDDDRDQPGDGTEPPRTRGRLTWPEHLLRTIDAQHGVVARPQLVSAFGEHVVDDLVRARTFERVERGVYRAVGGVRLPQQAAFAAALRARPNATITGPLILHLLGIPGIGNDAPFEILVERGRRLTQVDFAWRADPDPDRPITRRGAVRTASPIDALIDSAPHAAALGGERVIRVAWDHLRWQLDQRAHRLEQRIEQLRGLTPGAAALESILEVGGGALPESEGERRLSPFGRCFRPALEAQVFVTPRRRIDLYSRLCRMGWELVGDVDHAYVAARIRDDERDTELREEGIRLHYVTSADLDEPRTLLATMAGALTVRAHELGVVPPVAVRTLEAVTRAP